MSGALDGRTALVTGASRGIGAAIARRFAAEGAAVGLVARTMEEEQGLPGSLIETRRLIEEAGGEAESFPCNLARADEREGLVAKVAAALGPVSVLVNNAAANAFQTLGELKPKVRHLLCEVNFHAPCDLMQQAAADMKAAGVGHIVNISSRTAEHPQGPPYNEFNAGGHPALYGSTKAALDRFTAGVAAELHGGGVVANCLAPVAAVDTPGMRAMGYVPKEGELESVETMAEAALALCVCGADETGLCALSGEYLKARGIEVRGLDGRPMT